MLIFDILYTVCLYVYVCMYVYVVVIIIYLNRKMLNNVKKIRFCSIVKKNFSIIIIIVLMAL